MLETRWSFDAGGRLVERVLWHFDAAGQLVRQGWDTDDDGDLDQWEETTWDASGRWTRRQYFHDGGAPGRALVRTFDCE